MLQIQIPLNPVPASRPRVTRRGFSYYGEPYKSFKRDIKELLKERYTSDPIDYPVSVTLVCEVVQPGKTKLDAPKPDVDNYAKAILDGMNEIVLKDDSLVTKLRVTKVWAAPREPGRITVFVERDPNPEKT